MTDYATRAGSNATSDIADRGAAAFGRVARRSMLAFALSALALASSASAHQATPVATPTAIDPGACTVEPRPTDQMRQLIQTGLPPIVAFMAGTPTRGDDATPHAPVADDEPAADEATVAAVTDVVLQWAACTEAGDLAAVAALLTEQGAATFLSFGYLSFQAIFTGAMSTPTAEIDPTLVDLYLGAIQLRASIPPDFQTTLYGIESVTQLQDDRVRVIALLATGTEEPRPTSILLRQEDGRYRIVFVPETGSVAQSTPDRDPASRRPASTRPHA